MLLYKFSPSFKQNQIPIKFAFLLVLFFFLHSLKSFGQFNYTCTTHEIHDRLLKESKEYKYQYERINNEIYQVLKHRMESPDLNRSGITNYVIPVVVHIITPPGTAIGKGNNITDSQVQYGLQLLNDAFANNGDFKTANGVDIGISFCLAKRDPNGQPTNGITRHESLLVADVTPCTPFGTDMNNGSAIKAIESWDCKDYINIWLVTDLYNSSFGCSLAGFATFPGAGCGFDGVVQESRYWITKGGTTVSAHEIGHYFSLNHTFNGGCTNNDCLLDGDQVCDTPPDGSPSFAACNTNSCNTDTPDLLDDNTNYMDYTSCTPPHFTQGQKDRMVLGLEKGRPGLIKSQGCISVVNNDVALIDLKVIGGGCGGDICTKIIIKNTGINIISTLDIIIKIDGTTILTFPWTGNLIPNTKDTLKLPCVNAIIGSHSITIELINPNGQLDGFIDNNLITIANIDIYPKPNLSLVEVDSTHCGSNGKIIVQASGGTIPYQFIKTSDPLKLQVSPIFYDLKNQIYNIVIIDGNKCQDTVTINVPDICPPCISGIINKYAAIYSFCDSATINVDDASGFNPGDKILIYQAIGATVDSTNTPFFGDVLDYGNSGNYEFNQIVKIEGNKITFKYYLLNKYNTPVGSQVVNVPNLHNATVCNLSCAPWNGQKGGILVFDADSLTLAGNIDVSGKGFRGGIIDYSFKPSTPFMGYFSSSPNDGGTKGEAIASLSSNYKYAKGKIANAGGGGNNQIAGGAGGANFGDGGLGGMGFNPQYDPSIQGLNGVGLDYTLLANNLFFGGGGGSGQSNKQGCSSGTSGANGGGIAILNVKSCIGNNNKIIASGSDAQSTSLEGCNGAGGGGGGGIILFNSLKGSSDLNIISNGGNGGNTYYYQLQGFIGPGGGGGGGLILTNLSAANLLASHSELGGLNGKLNVTNDYGATPGKPGKLITGYQIQKSNVLYNPIGNIHIKIDTLCYGSGYVAVNTTLGTEFLEYKLDNGFWQPYGSYEGFKDGYHTISIRSKCVQVDTIIYVKWPKPLTDSLLFLNSVSCNDKGRIGITGLNGSQPYQYKLNGGTAQTNGIFTNLDPGNYIITIIDNKGCQTTKTLNISDLSVKLNLITDSLDLQKTCVDTNSFIAVHAEGSNPYYYYSLNGGPHQPIGYFTNLSPGNYNIIAYDEYGCKTQSIDYTVTMLNNTSSSSNTFDICPGDKITVGNHIYNVSGIYHDTLSSYLGCDSIIVSILKMHPAYFINNLKDICPGDTVFVGIHKYFTSGVYMDHLQTYNGCDSVITTNLNVVPFKNYNQSISICKGNGIQVGTNNYSLPGVYIDTLLSFGGCDSIVNTKLNVIDSSSSSYSYNICQGQSININNKTYNQSGNYTDKLTNYLGCDSIIKIQLKVSDTSFFSQTLSICPGDTITISNQVYNKVGIYKNSFVSASGCDSTVITNIINSPSDLCDSVNCKVFIPTAFSPDGDGINDFFEVFTNLVNITQMDIFDRWGELVSSIVGNTPRWNGKTKSGKNMHQGVYIYLLYGKCSDGKDFLKAGEVTLIR